MKNLLFIFAISMIPFSAGAQSQTPVKNRVEAIPSECAALTLTGIEAGDLAFSSRLNKILALKQEAITYYFKYNAKSADDVQAREISALAKKAYTSCDESEQQFWVLE